MTPAEQAEFIALWELGLTMAVEADHPLILSHCMKDVIDRVRAVL